MTTYILSLRLRESVLDDILKDQGEPHVHPFTVHLSIYACGLVAHVVLLTALNPKIGFSLGFDSLGFRAGAKLGLLTESNSKEKPIFGLRAVSKTTWATNPHT